MRVRVMICDGVIAAAATAARSVGVMAVVGAVVAGCGGCLSAGRSMPQSDTIGPMTAQRRAELTQRIEALAARHKLMLGAPIRTIRRHLNSLGEARITFDAGFSPRLDYYTGIVFEMRGQDGAVLVSGGQYDRLLERLGAKAPIAASGCALWVDRLEAEWPK